MPLSPQLHLGVSQAPVMTPRLQQAIQLLQLSNLELAACVEAELQRNPLIEHDDGPGGGRHADSADARLHAATPPARAINTPATNGRSRVWSGRHKHGKSVLPGDLPGRVGAPGQSVSETGGERSDLVAAEKTLRQHLHEQLGVEVAEPGERAIGAHLIELIDETGYLPDDAGSLAGALGCSPDRIEAVLRRLQDFDPPGVFARNLAECLALQLRDRNRLNPAMQALLENLDLLAEGDLSRLRRRCGVDDASLRNMAAEIRTLDPKPGLSFATAPEQIIVPDILMQAGPDSGWIIELNPESLPRILVNRHYFAEIGKRRMPQADRDYLNDCYESASWLARAMHRRATTILRVAREIVRQQDAFFRHGVQHLKPLVLRDIADAVGLHESTVSRVTSNKHIATPRGVLDLKYFFNSAISSTSGGAALSAEAVRSRIRLLVDQESPDQVLSDDRLVGILQSEGIDIARRTVAKYRDIMRIPSSFRRRRRKRQFL